MAQFDVVFEGGGAKGSAFVGALTALTAAGHSTRRLVGTSAGAITASLLAVGYTPQEMLAAVNERLNGKPRFASFMDHPHGDDFTQAEKDASDTMITLEKLHIPLVAGHVVLKGLLATPLYPTLFSIVECGGVVRRVGIRCVADRETGGQGDRCHRHAGGRLREEEGGSFGGHVGHLGYGDAGAQSPHGARSSAGVGSAHVDEHSADLARGCLAGSMGHVHGPQQDGEHACRWRRAFEFPDPPDRRLGSGNHG